MDNYRSLSIYYRLVSLYRDTISRLEGYGIGNFPDITKVNSELDDEDNLVLIFEFEFHGKTIVTETKIPFNCDIEMIDTYRMYHISVDNYRYNSDFNVSDVIKEQIYDEAPPHIKDGKYGITYLIVPSIDEFYTYIYDKEKEDMLEKLPYLTIEYDGYLKIGTDEYELDGGEVFNLEGDIFMIPLYYTIKEDEE